MGPGASLQDRQRLILPQAVGYECSPVPTASSKDPLTGRGIEGDSASALFHDYVSLHFYQCEAKK